MFDEIRLSQWFNDDYNICQTDFIIDLKSKTAYFKKYEYEDASFDTILFKDSEFKNKTKNHVNEIFALENNKMQLIIDEINKLKHIGFSHHDWRVNRHVKYKIIFLEDGLHKDSIHINLKYADELIKFNQFLEKMFGFPIFDISLLDHVISEHKYKICRDGIYDAETLKKLKLNKIEYDFSWGLFFGGFAWVLDLENKKLDYSQETYSFDDISLNGIFQLIENYGVYEWHYPSYYEKTDNHEVACLDGGTWELKFIFDEDKILVLSDGPDFPDTYYNLALEVKSFCGLDLLGIKEVPDPELYEKYGRKKIKGFRYIKNCNAFESILNEAFAKSLDGDLLDKLINVNDRIPYELTSFISKNNPKFRLGRGEYLDHRIGIRESLYFSRGEYERLNEESKINFNTFENVKFIFKYPPYENLMDHIKCLKIDNGIKNVQRVHLDDYINENKKKLEFNIGLEEILLEIVLEFPQLFNFYYRKFPSNIGKDIQFIFKYDSVYEKEVFYLKNAIISRLCAFYDEWDLRYKFFVVLIPLDYLKQNQLNGETFGKNDFLDFIIDLEEIEPSSRLAYLKELWLENPWKYLEFKKFCYETNNLSNLFVNIKKDFKALKSNMILSKAYKVLSVINGYKVRIYLKKAGKKYYIHERSESDYFLEQVFDSRMKIISERIRKLKR